MGSEVVGSARKPGNKTGIQHIGQNGVYKDGCVCRGLMKSMAEEGSSSIELSQQCSERSLEFCGYVARATVPEGEERVLSKQDSGVIIFTSTRLLCFTCAHGFSFF